MQNLYINLDLVLNRKALKLNLNQKNHQRNQQRNQINHQRFKKSLIKIF